jgi:dihydrodiol dehydrogenase / D-xylose 1-dehydrogenase (NADP)
MTTKWGIASSGKISQDFVNALSTFEDESAHKVVAVAARSLDSAKEFADMHNIPKAYEGKCSPFL